jgi:Cof subfamily protein (haloacid dehalogenase superfamily)
MIDTELLRNLKLIVFDLDGTLLNNEGEISQEAKDLIKELERKGVHFTFASGRLHSALLKYAEELELDTHLISLDGSLIKHPRTDEILFESYIPLRYVKKAVRLAESTLTKYALCHADAIFYTEENSIIPEMLEKYGAKYQEVESLEKFCGQTLEIVFVGDARDNIKLIQKKMLFPHSFGLRTSYYKSHLFGGIYYLEVRKSGASKGDGVKRLAKKMSIGMRNVAVLGDWYNDRSLFETEALKVAVANAVPEIIHKADYVTKKTNDEGGVAEFLKMVADAKK